jgi:hippurate hydrolase
VRTFDRAVRAVVAETVQRVCEGVAAAHGVEVEVRYVGEYPVTVNDQAEAAFALGVAEDLFGAGAALRMPNPITGSEDFSRVIAEVPGAMLFVGALADGRDPMTAPSNHSPRAAFHDGVLEQGAVFYAMPDGPSREDLDQIGRTFAACGPFWPCVTSNSTRWFSSSER